MNFFLIFLFIPTRIPAHGDKEIADVGGDRARIVLEAREIHDGVVVLAVELLISCLNLTEPFKNMSCIRVVCHFQKFT